MTGSNYPIKTMKNLFTLLFLATLQMTAQQSPEKQSEPNPDKFKQMYDLMATPNMYRTASGAPGPEYYQQQADYKMDIELDDRQARLYGTQTVTYYNNAKEPLEYLWVQLDQNRRARTSKSPLVENSFADPAISAGGFAKKYMAESFDGGFKIDYVRDAAGKPLSHTVNETMMRINLDKPLKHGEKFVFSIKWWYNINNYQIDGGRSGYEQFPDGNRLYVIAQFYPRMAVYNDVEGWQNMQFWGSGEFALPFGNFEVNITVPADHFLDATGVLQNRDEVFTPEQLRRYKQAEKTYDKPVLIVTQAEAEAAEKSFSTKKKTWKFKAENVRDFGISTSRKFICDAMAVKLSSKDVMAVSLYPKEGNPLWEEYSTRIVAHTLKTYSKYTFDYPYPKAISVNAEDQGMEYPMICWNFGRPDPVTKITSDRTKYGMLGVIIHEVGHNWFPMIVNSDERQWTWMDEGLNTYLEYITEIEWEPTFPVDRGPARLIVPYMAGSQAGLEPIMTNSEAIRQFGNNAYGKPATALNILRETIMGRELFDHAFKTYANRWKFKHPTPEDFFRTMEDASAVDLDWFWRGWFFTTDNVDIGIKEVKRYFVSAEAPKDTKPLQPSRRRRQVQAGPMVYMVPESNDMKPEAKKAFNRADIKPFDEYIAQNFTAEERAKLKNPKHFYQVTFDKPGGLVMPIIIELTFTDGTTEEHRFPAQIWRKNDKQVTRVFATEKEVAKFTLDPKLETADVDTTNNSWPRQEVKSKFD